MPLSDEELDRINDWEIRIAESIVRRKDVEKNEI